MLRFRDFPSLSFRAITSKFPARPPPTTFPFAIATSIGFLVEGMEHGTLIITLSYLIAAMVAQSRIEGKIHTPLEVGAGSLIGIFISILIFSIFG